MEQQKLSFDYRLALMSGVDVPLSTLQTVIHQPTIKEISMIGEDVFFLGLQIMCIDKNVFVDDISEAAFSQLTNFSLLMQLLNDPSMGEDKKYKLSQFLTLLFPEFKIIFTPRSIYLNSSEQNCIIDEDNFEKLQAFLKDCFCLKESDQDSFNPQSKKAKEIAQKLLKARKRVAELKQNEHSGSVLAQYLSVLTIGLSSMTLSDCLNLTIYQLHDLLERYSMFINWDLDIKSRLAGASGDKPVESWMKSIH